MKTESTTRKRLADITAKDARFACVVNDLIFLDYFDHFESEDRRISFRLDQLDLAVARAKVKASESMTDEEKRATLERENEEAEEYRRSLIRNEQDFDPQDNF